MSVILYLKKNCVLVFEKDDAKIQIDDFGMVDRSID